MSESREVAEAAVARHGSDATVLEFRVLRSELDELAGLAFDSADGAWGEFVRFHRTNQPELLRHGGEAYDFASGPMFARFSRRAEHGMRALPDRSQISIHPQRAFELFN